MIERLGKFFEFTPNGALTSSLIVMLIVAILAITMGIMARRADPLKKPRGLLLLADIFVTTMQNFVKKNMGENWENMTGYFMGLGGYLFIAFIWSITGLPSIIDNLWAPLALALVMWVLIQFTALRYQHFHYFHRYVEPIFLFLPINMISAVTPILSTTLRMFGNALSGTIIISIVSWALKRVSVLAFGFMGEGLSSIWFAPIPIGVLNLYFALFSGFIQTLVFMSLNAVWIANERPDDAMGLKGQALRGPEEKASI